MRDAKVGQVVRFGPTQNELMKINELLGGGAIQPEGYRGYDLNGQPTFAIGTDCELATKEELELWESRMG